jgi:Holliday junction resolvase
MTSIEQELEYGKNDAKRKKKTKNQRIAQTRRQRGYNWEDTLVKRFNAIESWKAFRLGSPSVGLPDILAVSTTENTIYTIEAKSGTNTTLRVPFDQIERCLKWIHTFDLYKKRQVVVAFKFSSKKRVGVGKYEHRELREYFKIWDEKNPVSDFICTYGGDTYAISERKRNHLKLESCVMPFIKKQVLTKPNPSLM